VDTQLTNMRDDWANIIQELRKEARVTRKQLAAQTGVGARTIDNYEKRKIRESSIYKVEAILNAFGYDLEAIKRY